MNLSNRIALIATSAVTVGAIVLAGPALAHTKPGPKATSKAIVTSTGSPTVAPTANPTPPKSKDGKGRHGNRPHPEKPKGAPITQTVTVDVPVTGSYQLLVTAVKPANTSPTQPVFAPNRPDHSFTVPVTGTGSQTVTLNLPHPGNYTVSLVSVVSTQSITIAPPTK
ncbi:MAG: hypothetical protein JHD31_01825 [Rhodoluna sp.]|nr:hypothetical protein [Rhodoluna sp.]